MFLNRRNDPVPECDGKGRRLSDKAERETQVQMEETCVLTADPGFSPLQMIVTGRRKVVLEVDSGVKAHCLFSGSVVSWMEEFSPFFRESVKLLNASWGESEIWGGSDPAMKEYRDKTPRR